MNLISNFKKVGGMFTIPSTKNILDEDPFYST